VDLKKAYDSVRRGVLYNIPLECGVRMKLVRLIKMCLNETYSKVHVSKHLSDNFTIPSSTFSSRLLSKNVKIIMYKIIILPVVLYRCETWSLTLREEHRLRVFEKRVLSRIL
jgi:hypothetical protein